MDNWNEYSRHVLNELKRLNNNIEKLDRGQREIEKDIIKLQTKATVWGAIGGFLIALITNVLVYLIKK